MNNTEELNQVQTAEPNSDESGFRTWRAVTICQEHPEDKPVRGWAVVTSGIFDRHSVVDRGSSGLLDITPLSDRSCTEFLIHNGSQAEFDGLPNEVYASPGEVGISFPDGWEPPEDPIIG